MKMMLSLVLMSVAPSASATYSVAAVDFDSRDVGAALTSCVGNLFDEEVLPSAVGIKPGAAVILTQGCYFEF